jgi:ribosomal-protein-alanine N-acetyltransferase
VLTLRPWEPRDADVLVQGWHDPDIARFTQIPPEPTRATALRWIRAQADRPALDLAIVPAGATRPVGDIGLFRETDGPRRAEIGWWLLPEGRGRGLATDAVTILTAQALETRAQVYARIKPANAPAQAVAERAGYQRLGTASDGFEVWATMVGWTPRHGDPSPAGS